jgi:hypothetical protein
MDNDYINGDGQEMGEAPQTELPLQVHNKNKFSFFDQKEFARNGN